ncbi:30S ribosomal protein S6 [Chrysiogenes arsenatis]|uniref:30S ribosomal protein S6 n=1 Tax=Chrysiogenes arsenatis TaxID=309797 RepID=UPI0004173E30|nr:30S ribosomal protein S6 [Chrysiogenes arsenatis]
MRKYEVMFIAQPELGEDELKAYIARIDDIIARFEGKIDKFENWGKKKLAYPIQKKSYGHYLMYHVDGQSAMIDEIERIFKISDEVMRHIVVKLEKDALEAMKKAADAVEARAKARAARLEEETQSVETQEPVAAEAAAEEAPQEAQ